MLFCAFGTIAHESRFRCCKPVQRRKRKIWYTWVRGRALGTLSTSGEAYLGISGHRVCIKTGNTSGWSSSYCATTKVLVFRETLLKGGFNTGNMGNNAEPSDASPTSPASENKWQLLLRCAHNQLHPGLGSISPVVRSAFHPGSAPSFDNSFQHLQRHLPEVPSPQQPAARAGSLRILSARELLNDARLPIPL